MKRTIKILTASVLVIASIIGCSHSHTNAEGHASDSGAHPKKASDALSWWEVESSRSTADQAKTLLEETLVKPGLMKVLPVDDQAVVYKHLGDKFFAEGAYKHFIETYDEGRLLVPGEDDRWMLIFASGLAREPEWIRTNINSSSPSDERDYAAACAMWAAGDPSGCVKRIRQSMQSRSQGLAGIGHSIYNGPVPAWQKLALAACLCEMNRFEEAADCLDTFQFGNQAYTYAMRYYPRLLYAKALDGCKRYETEVRVLKSARKFFGRFVESSYKKLDDEVAAKLLELQQKGFK